MLKNHPLFYILMYNAMSVEKKDPAALVIANARQCFSYWKRVIKKIKKLKQNQKLKWSN